MKKRPLLATIAVSASIILTASTLVASCGGSGSKAADDTAATQENTMTESDATTIIIDVRAPSEYAEGHVQGAVNLNVEDGTLEAELASLDPSRSYSVYCRSGRRSAIAAELMASKGFGNVADLGSLEQAADSLQRPIVND